jgi:Suppressor of fused protein (SUFU)
MKTDAEAFITHFEQICQTEPAFYPISEKGESPPLHVLWFDNLPDKGDSIGITYGLSLADHKKWVHGRPELIIAVHSNDPSWSLAAGEVAYRLRGNFPFCYGDTIGFRTRISDESEMSAFVVSTPSVLEEQDRIVWQEGWDIHIAQLYPIYESERVVIAEKGLKYFFRRSDLLFWDVNRAPIS